MSKKAMGIRNAHYAIYNSQTNKFDAPVAIPDLETLAISETFAEGSNYADNLRNIYIKELVGAEISMGFSNLTRETEAKLTGQAYKNGELEFSVTAVAPTVALLFEKTYSDGSVDRIVYYNCKLTKDSEDGESKTDSFNFTGDTLSGQAIPTKDGLLKYVISSDLLPQDKPNENQSEEYKANTRFINFFKEVMFKGKDATEPRTQLINTKGVLNK